MSSLVVSDIQTQAEVHIRIRDTNGCERSYSSKILEIGMILGEKNRT